MGLLLQAAFAYFAVIGAGLMLKGAGGWFHLYRARHGRGDPNKRTWESLGVSFKGWYFILPVLAVYAIGATIGGIVLVLR
jgi:hypothetical protein